VKKESHLFVADKESAEVCATCGKPWSAHYKDNYPGPVDASELSPEKLAQCKESAEWGRKFAEGMVKNLRKKTKAEP
jgi:hypothetical protein